MVKVPSPEAYQKTMHVRRTSDYPPQQPWNGQTKKEDTISLADPWKSKDETSLYKNKE
jgi:hypothetical protein